MCVNLVALHKLCEKSRCFYTAGTNFTRPPVVTVATNLNSDKYKGKDKGKDNDKGEPKEEGKGKDTKLT